jgi:hypothetical protein
MDDKITIIEGPPPTFEAVSDGWALGLNESNLLTNVALTRLRTFNGQGLLERCHRAWRRQDSIHLEYRGVDGLESQAPILAARTVEVDDGQVLLLWVRQELDEEQLAAGLDDGEDDELTGDTDFPE